MTFKEQCKKSQDEFSVFYRERFVKENGNPVKLNNFFKNYNISHSTTSVNKNGKILTISQVKYNQACKFEINWMHSCRGTTIISHENEILQIIFCFNKFFNVHEFSKYMGNISHLDFLKSEESKTQQLVLNLKEDGTNIKTYCDIYGNIHSTTLGSSNPDNYMQGGMKNSPTFSGLSIELLQRDFPKIIKFLKANPGWSCVSELKSKFNIIVTKYSYPEGSIGIVSPLAIIDNSGTCRYSHLREMYPMIFEDNGYPKHSVLTSSETFSEDSISYIEGLKQKPDEVGEIPEGFVVAIAELGEDGLPDKFWPCMKGKDADYIEYHGGMSLNPGKDKDLMAVQLRVVNGTWDDMKDDFGREIREKHVTEFEDGMKKIADTLHEVLPSLYKNKNDPKLYSMTIKNMDQKINWIAPSLFRLRKTLPEVYDSLGFLYDILKSKSSGVSYITNMHTKYGVYWWKKETNSFTTEKRKKKPTNSDVVDEVKVDEVKVTTIKKNEKILVVFDFDDTISNTAAYKRGDIADQSYHLKIASCLQAYNNLPTKIVVLTAREHKYNDKIKKYFKANFGMSGVEVYTRDSNDNFTQHKVNTVKKLISENGFGTVVHFDDDSRVLRQSYDMIEETYKNVRYLGHLCKHGEIVEITASAKKTVILSLIQPPGTGKTSVFDKIEEEYKERGLVVNRLSPDRIYHEWKNESPSNDGVIPPDVMFARIMTSFTKGVDEGGLFIIDMCHSKSDTLKRAFKTGCTTIFGTFMCLSSKKNKKGKNVTFVDPKYEDFIKKNVNDRIENGEMNGSTLNSENASSIAIEKAKGCLNQITKREIERYSPNAILSIDSMFEILKKKIDDAFSSVFTPTSHKHSAYLGVPVNVENIIGEKFEHGEGFYGITNHHITKMPPSKNLSQFVQYIGTSYPHIIYRKPFSTTNTVSLIATNQEKELKHVTLAVREGFYPNDTFKELEKSTKISDWEYEFANSNQRIGTAVLL